VEQLALERFEAEGLFLFVYLCCCVKTLYLCDELRINDIVRVFGERRSLLFFVQRCKTSPNYRMLQTCSTGIHSRSACIAYAMSHFAVVHDYF
jgi:hypothetical protein